MRYLRYKQIFGRIYFYISYPRIDLAFSPSLRKRAGRWIQSAQREPSLSSPDTFIFFGKEGSLCNIGWGGLCGEKLWSYNQHYFDDLNARDSKFRVNWHQSLLNDWVLKNPLGKAIAWDSYPTSLRIVNWIKWVLMGNKPSDGCIYSLGLQARWLVRRLENHLLGNHLLANAKALVFAGLFFQGPEADRWLKIGAHILEQEIKEQILSDGGHFERSTMYHALALEDMLDLCNIFNVYSNALSEDLRKKTAQWNAKIPSMLNWLLTMSHPDGGIGFFNDAANGVAPTNAEIIDYMVRLGFGAPALEAINSRWLKQTGYARLADSEAVVLLDLAPVGPDYLPGHAHADTLSFELSVRGRRILVNSGTSCYGVSAERLRQRETSAHNTVVIENQSSTEVWSSFRVARRARILSSEVQVSSEMLNATGSHDGYTRLPGRPIHTRHFTLHNKKFIVKDLISKISPDGVARFHLHPDVKVLMGKNKLCGRIIVLDEFYIGWKVDFGSDVWSEPATWHPNFGVSIANECLCVRLSKGKSQITFDWSEPNKNLASIII